MREKRIVCAGILAAGILAAPLHITGQKVLRADADREGSDQQIITQGEVGIDEKNFPDKVFRKYVSDSFDINRDGQLSQSEIKAVQTIDCTEKEIYSLEGIGFFADIEYLFCSYTKVQRLDLSANTKMRELLCCETGLCELNVSKNEDLEYILCGKNQLTELNVSKNAKLTGIECYENQIDKLDLTHNPELVRIDCYGNNIRTLDTSKNPKLEYLSCGFNPISKVDVSTNPKLKEFWCYGGNLSKLDLSGHKDLYYLSLVGNPLPEFYICDCTRLFELMKKYPLQKDSDSHAGDAIVFSEGELEIDGQMTRCAIFFNESSTMITDRTNTPEPSVTPTPEPVTPIPGDPVKEPDFEDFVERLYVVALNRDSEEAGKKFWVEKVKKGEYNGADCARYFLVEAPEFMNRKLNDSDFLEVLYKTFYDRASDKSGKEFWMNKLKQGAGKASVVNEFIESAEWCNVCATYGVRSGAHYHKAEFASKNAIKFATRLYTCCLGREAEEEGLQYWSLALTNLEKTGYGATKQFFTSEEFLGFKTSDEEYVKRLYRTFMGRDPEASEVSYWVEEIHAARQTRNSVLQFFGGSKEFTGICNQYGIERGEID